MHRTPSTKVAFSSPDHCHHRTTVEAALSPDEDSVLCFLSTGYYKIRDGPPLYSRWEGCGSRNSDELSVCTPTYAHPFPQPETFQDKGKQNIDTGKQNIHSRALGNFPQPKKHFPNPYPKRPDSLETFVFVSLITGSDSTLWAVWMAYPSPSQDHSLFCCIVRKLWLGI